jgi:hypothetical protein
MIEVDILSVIIATVVYMIISFIWFSPFIFGKIWKKVVPDIGKGAKLIAYFSSLLIALVVAYFLAIIEGYLGVTSFWDGVVAGFIVWLGFVATTSVSSAIWSNKWKVFFIEQGCWLINFIIMGGIIAG